MRRRRLPLSAACATLLHRTGLAQTWPARPVTIVVPFSAGGGTDAFARPLFGQPTKQAGQQLVIDRRGGGVGTIAATVARMTQDRQKAFASRNLRAIRVGVGAEPPALDAEFGAFVDGGAKRWAEVVKAAPVGRD